MKRSSLSLVGALVIACSPMPLPDAGSAGGGTASDGGGSAGGGTASDGGGSTGGGTAGGGSAGGGSTGGGSTGGGATGGGSTGGGSTGGGSAGGGSPDAGRDAGTRDGGFPTYTVLNSAPLGQGITIEIIEYLSGSLKIKGLVCRPTGSANLPILMWNHGGGGGVGADELTVNGYCYRIAKLGVAVFESSYRGEDGSDGVVEGCHGEADDVNALLEIARHQPWVNPAKIGMAGGSHGGCVTLRSLQYGAQVSAATAFFPATSVAGMIEFYEYKLAVALDGGTQGQINDYAGRLHDYLGICGGHHPADCPDAAVYDEHQPNAAIINSVTSPLMIIHGLQDALINYVDSCRFVSSLSGYTSYRIDNVTTVLTSAPAGCALPGINFTPGPVPTKWTTTNRGFLIYDDLQHGTNVEATGALGTGLQFIGDHF